jgi:predicted RNA-binding Zn-ribbon protein involved in translation (DUF1610 family)
MSEKISRSEAISLISKVREVVCDKKHLDDLIEDYNASTIYEALLVFYGGVSNGFLSQVCEAISGRRMEVVGEAEVRFPCPCCGRRTLTEVHNIELGTGYDICDYCRWEDDGTVDDTVYSSVNKGSMIEYRARIHEESNYYFTEKWRL